MRSLLGRVLGADVDDARALCLHGAGTISRQRRVGTDAVTGEGVRRRIDDAHDHRFLERQHVRPCADRSRCAARHERRTDAEAQLAGALTPLGELFRKTAGCKQRDEHHHALAVDAADHLTTGLAHDALEHSRLVGAESLDGERLVSRVTCQHLQLRGVHAELHDRVAQSLLRTRQQPTHVVPRRQSFEVH
jgi:hypothetical protein